MEQKKASRPTVAQVRQLESEVSVLRSEKDRLEQTLSEQKMKYGDLHKEYDKAVKDMESKTVSHQLREELKRLRASYKTSEDIREDLKAKNATLEMSNVTLDKEIKRLRAKAEDSDRKIKALNDEIARLTGRGLWARILNR